MPRDYKNPGGPASPTPTGFGSADLNLQTPRFVAQTNVALPENQFATLQKILGMAVEVGGQFMNYQTKELEGKISYQKAIEAKQEREEVLKRRAEADVDRLAARAAAEFSANTKIEIAKATTPEEAKAIMDRVIKTTNPNDTVEMKTAQAQVIQQAETEANQLKTEKKQAFLDELTSSKAKSDEQMQNLFQAGDAAGLKVLADSFQQASSKETDPRGQQMYQALRQEAYAKSEALKNKAEFDDKKQEAALASAAKDAFSVSSSQVVSGLMANIMKTADSLGNYTDDALSQATYDFVREKVLKDPSLSGLVISMGPAEEKAAADAIRQSSEILVRAMVSQRNQKYAEQAEANTVSSYANWSILDLDGTLDAIAVDETLSDRGRTKAYNKIAQEQVAAQDTDIGKLKAAIGLQGRGIMALEVQSSRMQKEILGNIATAVQQEHNGLVDARQQEGDEFSVGWTAKYNTRDEFLKDILERHYGTGLDSIQNPEVQSVIGPAINRLAAQWEEDTNKSQIAERRADAEIRASNSATRSKMKTMDVWKVSPLYRILQDRSHKDMKVDDLEPIIIDSLVGYSDTTLPTELKDRIVDGFDDPNNFTLVAAYWKVMDRFMDPTARNNAISSVSAMRSWALGQYLNFLGPEVDGQTTSSLGSEMARNLQARGDSVTNNGTNTTTMVDQRSAAMLALTGGTGLSEGWFDVTGFSQSQALELIPPADTALLMNYASIAASAPNSADAGAFMASMMKSQGFSAYPVKDDDRGTTFRIVQNVKGARGTTPLPPSSVLETSEWTGYLDYKKPAIAAALNTLPLLDVPGAKPREGIFKESDIEDVSIAIYDQDVKQGHVAVRAKVSGFWRSIPTKLVSVSYEDFVATKAAVKENFKKVVGEPMKSNNPWIPDVYENLFK